MKHFGKVFKWKQKQGSKKIPCGHYHQKHGVKVIPGAAKSGICRKEIERYPYPGIRIIDLNKSEKDKNKA
jgi:hypothetical protein